MDCVFCQIAEKKIPAELLFEDDEIMAFRDLFPQAPIHILIVPKKHIPTIDHLDTKDELLVGRMILTAKRLAKELNITGDGYRLVFNVNEQGGQTVYHIHLHVVGGRQMKWPPG